MVSQALAAFDGESGPVVVNDTSDNTGAGAPGDATHLLRAVLDCPERDAAGARLDEGGAFIRRCYLLSSVAIVCIDQSGMVRNDRTARGY